MFLNAKNFQNDARFESQVCIIGGGTAGLALALELARNGIHTAVLESGGYSPDKATRDLNRGESIGIPYQFADGCRSRFLGGSSNCWGGWCRPLEDHDFAERSWIPNSGWPFGREHIDPYYRRAHEVLKLGIPRYDTSYWVNAINRPDVRQFRFAGDKVVDAVSQFSPPVRMGLDYHDKLRDSPYIKVYLYSNVIEFFSESDGTRITEVEAKVLNGPSFRVKAGIFVLATGGIENARLLLAGSKRHVGGIGNQNDVVGRYFMDHPRVRAGRVNFAQGWNRNKLYDHKFHYQNPTVSAHGTKIAAQLLLTAETQRQEGILNANVWFASIFPGEDTPQGNALMRMKHRLERKEQQGHTLIGDLTTIASGPLDSLGYVAARLFQPVSLIKGVMMLGIVEAAPDPMSRVTLSKERDALGMQRAVVDWRLDDRVKRTFDRSFAIVADELEASGTAQVTRDPLIEGNDWPSTFEDCGTWHHMGTTRMHNNPKKGVVDSDCLVHGMNNLYVAGSSVFPTVGANYPTLTLVALALRLADKLRATIEPASRPLAEVY